MIIILLCLVFGIGVGYVFRKRGNLFNINSKLVDFVLCITLLYLGISIGINDAIVSRLLDLGLDSVILAVGAIIGSIVFTLPIYYLLQRSKH